MYRIILTNSYGGRSIVRVTGYARALSEAVRLLAAGYVAYRIRHV